MRWNRLVLGCWWLAACGSEHDASPPPPSLYAREGVTALAPSATGDEVVYRINVGGPALSGTPGWAADTAGSPSPYGNASATASQVYAVSTAINMNDPSVPLGTPGALFQTERWDPAGGAEMQWNFPVQAGATYEVRLYFAEIYAGTMSVGARKMDVFIEGALVANDLDVFAAVGGYKGLVKTYSVTMGNSNLDLDFAHVVENPSLEGVEIIKKAAATPPPAATHYRVNVGGPAVAASDGGPGWSADTSASPSAYGNAAQTGSQTYATANAIDMTSASLPAGTPSALFQTERWDPAGGAEMQWNFPVAAGAYTVRLYFAEIYPGTQSVGARKFDVYLENQLVLNDYDVYAEAGGYAGVVKTFNVQSDANLDLDFGHVVENPSLEAIEIVSGTGGGGGTPAPVSFGKSLLQGEGSHAPTSLQFGPDGRLYVADMSGVIKIYTVARNGANSYGVTQTQTITSIQSIPNHNDDGALNTGVTGRLVTGLLVTGTAANPVLYVTSSDPRIGGGATGDLNVDTNSGMLSRLTWTGTAWSKKDLVRGLPRSEENHASNGMALAGGMLYLAQGGHTNMGAPSKNFVYTPEYALSAAVLKINLAAIGETTYDLPTLDDESRGGTPDAGDPFGGNGGKNQAKLVSNGPVQVHAPGFRNSYDVVITAAGKMYTIDNGSNAGWGDVPIGEGAAGTCTNGINEPGVTYGDGLHHVSAAGYYGGHPNPTRANTNNKFNAANPQSPVAFGNAVECDFRTPAAAGALVVFPSSTNGIAEYTASNFGGAMKGNLLAAGYVYNTLYRIVLNATGTGVSSNAALFSSVGKNPLDVVAQGDAGPFPGTIWVADMGSGQIVVFEPGDYGATPAPSCTGADDALLDEDADGFSNSDEIDNQTNPCSAADVPPDADKDLLSNLNDPDDDNDGWSDTTDPFALDAQNGKGLAPNFLFEWTGGSSAGILGLGFTGLMTNGAANYESLFDADNMTAGGAAGVLTVDAVPPGDAYQTQNAQMYGFQVGVNASPAATGPFTVHTRILAPFLGIAPVDFQSLGLFVGTGDQDNYVKLVVSANGGLGGIQLLKETGAVTSNAVMASESFPGPEHADLYLRVDPAAATLTASYTVTVAGVTSARKAVGTAVSVPASWFTATNRGLAVGVISSALGAGQTFSATWDFIEATPEQPSGTATLAHDDFGRAVSGGWGSADVGGAWSVLAGAAADFWVGGGAGQVSATAGGGERVAALSGAVARDVDVAANLALTAAPASGELFGYLLVRRQAGGAYYRIGLRVTPTGKIYLRGQTNTQRALFNDADSGLVFSAGNYYRLRVRAEGADPTRLRARAWNAGAAEPSNWTVDTTSSASGLQQAGSVGVRVINGSSTNVVARFDALDAVVIGTSPPPSSGWATLAATGLARQEVSFTAAGGKLYLAGGGSTAQQAYDPATNSWSAAAALPQALDHIQAVAVNGEIFYIGGLVSWPSPAVGSVVIYNPATNSLRQGTPMPRPRGAGGTAVYNGIIYYAGGLSGGNAVNWFDRYNPATGVWIQLAGMPAARDHFHAAVAGTQFYAIGGRNVSIGATTTVNQAYGFSTGQWTSRAPLPTARGGFGAASLNGEIYIIGGEAGSATLGTVEIYSPGTNLWRTGPAMPTARHGIQAAVWNGKIYVAAGGTLAGSGGATQAHEALTP